MRAIFGCLCILVVLGSLAGASALRPQRPRHQKRFNSTSFSSVQLSSQTIDLVDQVLGSAANHSWEIGTRETALLELKSPSFFLYGPNSSIPPPPLTNASDIANISEVFQSVDFVLANKPAGIQTFFQDAAVGDPASVGIPFLIRNATMENPSASSNYSIATQEELTHLLAVQRDNTTGAISQREPPEALQIWADFVAMAPPFIAYYGAINNDQSLVQLGYQQVEAYHTLLLDANVRLLEHILYGNMNSTPPDHGHWSTGNAWFVMGLLRVERIISLSAYADSMSTQRANLLTWALEVTNATWSYQASSGFLYNYIDCAALGQLGSSPSCFEDAAGTALMAANTFRLAQILYSNQTLSSTYTTPDGRTLSPNLDAAEQAREYIVQHVNATTGIVGPIVNPEDCSSQLGEGGTSPEGEAFVLMLQAAYQDWWSLTSGLY
ncbi:hypothetical protein DL93DRAFT_2169008 [Clavulina sp. PMI_390]|nr:hypothetical protein DL93DRAFT_2169008 [Clavulina sp. PMI_390]